MSESTEPNAQDARNDNTGEDGQLANPGPVPDEPEDVSDTGDQQGDLTAQAGPARDDDVATDDLHDE
ncbi:hypothetical protein [Aeromicrobium sp.]|uniref:hypothetical protein n=1 Tax=Aeromicrobium sp. TaxID=1871063 RepID=UPI0030C41DA1